MSFSADPLPPSAAPPMAASPTPEVAPTVVPPVSPPPSSDSLVEKSPPPVFSPPPTSPAKKPSSSLMIFMVLFFFGVLTIFIIWRFFFYVPAVPPTVIPPTPTPLVVNREALFSAPTLVMQYNGRIAGLNDPIALAYITNSFKESSFLPREQGRNPTNTDIVLDLKTAKVILAAQIQVVDNHLQGQINESLVIYENNLVEDIVITSEFQKYLITLVERVFGLGIVNIEDYSKTASDSRNIVSSGGTIQNYLPLMKLKKIELNSNYQATLINQSKEKIEFEFVPLTLESSVSGRILLEYASYENNSAFSAQDYLSLQEPTTANTISVNGVTGLINYHTYQDPSDSQMHSIIITTVFPFADYYLLLSYDFRENFSDPETMINNLDSPEVLAALAPHQQQLNDYEVLGQSLEFSDRQ